MKCSIHTMAIETFVPMLRVLSELLGKAEQNDSTRGPGAVALMEARLAPDMLPLPMQVYFACVLAIQARALLTGQEPPRAENDDQTLADLQARIARTIADLQSAPATAFEGAEDRDIELALQNNLVLAMKGTQYLKDWSLPNFYFHVVTAYAILRHHGVPLGKQDYLSQAGPFLRPRDVP